MNPHSSSSTDTATRRVASVAFVLVVALIFAGVRSTTGLVWNDSATLSITLDGALRTGGLDFPAALDILKTAFASAASGGYRPLSTLFANLGIRYFAAGGSVFLWALPVGALIGLFILVLYSTARRLGNSPGFAALAALLVVCSSPFVASSWVIVAGVQVVVPLLICTSLFVYWKLADSHYRSVPLYCALLALFIVGPWFREFIGLAPLLVGLLDWIKRRRPTAIMLIAALGFFHAVYPGWIPHLVVPTAPTLPVYKMGLLGARVAAQAGSFDFQLALTAVQGALATAQFLMLLPSTILLMLMLAPVVRALLSRMQATRDTEHANRIELASSNRNVIFVSLWTASSLLPLFRVYTQETHLLYPLVPFAILTSLAAQYLWREATRAGHHAPAASIVLGIALLVGIGDQALNYPNSIRIVTAMNDGMQHTAGRIRNSVPPGSAIIGNALHLEDLRWLSGKHFVPYWTIESGIPYPPAERALLTRKRLAEFVSAKRDEVYLLDMDYDFLRHKRAYHSHRLVNRDGIAVEKLWSTEAVQVSYFFLDPIKHYTPRLLTNVLFAPDLENDFYRGRSRSGAPFMREIYVTYTLYKVLKVDP